MDHDKNCSVTKRDLEGERKITKVMQRQSLTTSLTWNNAHPVPKTGKVILLSPLPSIIIAEHDATWHGLSLQSVWVICPVVPPPNLLCTPNLFTEWMRKREGPNTVQTMSATAKTLLCYQHCFAHKFKAPYQLLWRKLTPFQPDTCSPHEAGISPKQWSLWNT